MLQSNLIVSNVSGAIDGMIFIITFLIGIYITYRALGSLKWDRFMFDPIGSNIRLLRFLFALLGGFVLGLAAAAYVFAVQLVQIMF
ncbi:DUF1146 family protein [Alicyclobacillus sp. SO9]|uniref:DUF1146 family protein n=1 Tax=Alicyclobacillus sp. SO9 TaxID=2665646 RepID=UPI0018E79063|nr:DUF1146 family protein [Alicyclobacillus sp. SO9]QQE78763.1 DUF1146 domain-containing protein [Alicyclobacillus sp. SO9]